MPTGTAGGRLKPTPILSTGDVVRWARPHQRGLVVAAIGEFDRGFRSTLDDVEVGDDVAGIVPDKARTGAARHGKDIACPDVAHTAARW